MAQATMAANPALKETYVHLKGRMDKAVDDFLTVAQLEERTSKGGNQVVDRIRSAVASDLDSYLLFNQGLAASEIGIVEGLSQANSGNVKDYKATISKTAAAPA